MIRLIISILLFIILAVFVALNAQHTTTVDIFGYELQEVSVAAVVTIALAVGVIYSFTLYVTNYLARARVERQKRLKRKNKEKATLLAEKEKGILESAEPAPKDTEGEPPEGTPKAKKPKKSRRPSEPEATPKTEPDSAGRATQSRPNGPRQESPAGRRPDTGGRTKKKLTIGALRGKKSNAK